MPVHVRFLTICLLRKKEVKLILFFVQNNSDERLFTIGPVTRPCHPSAKIKNSK